MNTLVLLVTASWAPAAGPMPMMEMPAGGPMPMMEAQPSFGCCGDGGCCCQPCTQRRPRFFKRMRCRLRRNAPCCNCCQGCCAAPCCEGCGGMMPADAGPALPQTQPTTSGYPVMPPISDGTSAYARPMPAGQPSGADGQIMPSSVGQPIQQAPMAQPVQAQQGNFQGFYDNTGPQMSEEMLPPN